MDQRTKGILDLFFIAECFAQLGIEQNQNLLLFAFREAIRLGFRIIEIIIGKQIVLCTILDRGFACTLDVPNVPFCLRDACSRTLSRGGASERARNRAGYTDMQPQ